MRFAADDAPIEAPSWRIKLKIEFNAGSTMKTLVEVKGEFYRAARTWWLLRILVSYPSRASLFSQTKLYSKIAQFCKQQGMHSEVCQ